MFFRKHRALSVHYNSSDIIVGSSKLQYWHVKCNLPLIYAYSACLLTANICSHISLYIVIHWECFKIIITMVIFSRNRQLRWTRLPPSLVNAMQVCKTQFHWSSWMEWPGINQSASTTHQPWETLLYFLFHRLLVHDFSRLSPGFGHFKHFSGLSPTRDSIFVFIPSSRMSWVL